VATLTKNVMFCRGKMCDNGNIFRSRTTSAGLPAGGAASGPGIRPAPAVPGERGKEADFIFSGGYVS